MEKAFYQDHLSERLKTAGLRPTRQRVSLARLLFAQGERHISAEQLHAEALAAQVSVSLATVYNTLHQFHRAGLLREVLVETGRSYFDTNVGDHHHIFDEQTGELRDIPGDSVRFSRFPDVPEGKRISRIDVVVHMTDIEQEE